MKKKILILLALLMALTVFFVACQDEPTSPEETTVADQPTEEPTQDGEEPTAAPETPTEEPTADPETPTAEPTGDPETPTAEPTGDPETPTEEPTEPETQDPMAPVNVFDAEALQNSENPGPGPDLGTLTLVDNYLHIAPSGADPNWYPFAKVAGARYIAIRYRSADATGADMQFYISSSGLAPSNDDTMLRQPIIVDGEWHVILFDTQPLIDAGYYDGEYVSYFRFDPLESGYVLDENGEPYRGEDDRFVRYPLPEGCSIDVEYIAFFHSVEAAEQYENQLHKPEAPVKDYTGDEEIEWNADGITVDGDASDWANNTAILIPADKFTSWVGAVPEGYNVKISFVADKDNLYALIYVADDVVVAGNKGADGYNGDHLQLAITLKGGKQAWYSFSYAAEGETAYLIDNTSNAPMVGAEIATKAVDGGWMAEVKLPISVLFANAGTEDTAFDAENPWSMEMLLCNVDRDVDADTNANAVGTFVGGEAWKDNGFALKLNWAEGMEINHGVKDPNAPALVVTPSDLADRYASGTTVQVQHVGSADVLTEDDITFIRLVTSGGDPYIVPIKLRSGLTLPNYLAISYRTNSTLDGQVFVGSGNAWTGSGDSFFPAWNENTGWNLYLVDLSQTEVTSITDNLINYLRLDFFMGAGAEGDYFDIEYVAFFESVEAAEAYYAVTHGTSDPDEPQPEEPECYDDLTVDFSQLSDQTGYHATFPAAGFDAPAFQLGYANWIAIGDVDLSMYSKVLISYAFDGGVATGTKFENASSHAIGLKDNASSYGQVVTDNFDGDIAHGDMVFSEGGWQDIRTVEIDLSEIDYNGPVFVTIHNPEGTVVAIFNVTFIGAEIPEETEPVDPDVPVEPETPKMPAEFSLNLYQANRGETLYFSGAMSGYYFATSSNPADAVKVYSEAVDGGYRMFFLDGETKTYLDIVYRDVNKANVVLSTDPVGVYVWNEEANTWTVTIDGTAFYLGTYNSYNTISASLTSYITGDSAANVGVSQFVAQWTEMPTIQEPETTEPEDTEPAEPETTEPEETEPDEPETPSVNTVDFGSFDASASGYVERATADGWTALANLATTYDFTNGQTALILNGKTSAAGYILSPSLANGISRISFKTAFVFSESADISLKVTITTEDGTIITTDAVFASPVQNTVYEFEYVLETPVTGNFTIKIENNCPSSSTKNKDRWLVWDLAWEGAAAEDEPEQPAGNVINVTTTDTYGFFDMYTFTAEAAGTYTFTVPAGLGFYSKTSYDAWGPAEVDFYDNAEGATHSVALAEGDTYDFYVGSTKKADWVIIWEYAEGEVGGDDTDEPVVSDRVLTVGPNTVTVTDADLTEGAIEYTFTAEAAGTYTFASNSLMAVIYIDELTQQRGQAYLEAGTYTIQVVVAYAGFAGDYGLTITYTAPESEDEDAGDVTGTTTELPTEIVVEGEHDLYYDFYAAENYTLVITYPAGCYVSGLPNFEVDTEALTYTVTVLAGDSFTINPWGNNAGTYTFTLIPA